MPPAPRLSPAACRLQLHYKTEKGAKRILAELGPGDHFGETAFLDGRSGRNTTVTCTAHPGCALRRLGRAEWEAALAASPQLNTAVREAAATRSRSRLRTIIDMAARTGRAEKVTLERGSTVFAQVRAEPRAPSAVAGERALWRRRSACLTSLLTPIPRPRPRLRLPLRLPVLP